MPSACTDAWHGRQARATLEEFEVSITRDSVKHPPPDGTVHPLAAYTLSFLKRLFGFEATIDTLFSDEENEVTGLPLMLSHPSTSGRCRNPHACIHQGEY